MFTNTNRGSFRRNQLDHPHRRLGSPRTTNRRLKYVVELRWLNNDQNRDEIVTLMRKLRFRPDEFYPYRTGGKFLYEQWSNALETIVYLWEVLLDGGASFMLVQVLVRCDDAEEELNSRLTVLFKERILGLMEGELVKKMRNRLNEEENDSMIVKKKIREFKSAMKCILDYLDGKVFESESCDVVKVLSLKGAFDWNKIYWMIKRECRRLDDGLPIYAHRTDILCQIHSQQVMVLAGDIGAGKSTQLVQFLADSGVAGDKSIVCTQPRKLAAMSLAIRVEEESHGCCEDNSVIFSSAYSSFRHLDSKVIYMTDHCLLEHYMNDKNFSWASCIIVDEAHGRSVNTDLLLALMKDLLRRRSNLRCIIVSRTADAQQLSEYFFDCATHHVVGRTFPCDSKYFPEDSDSDVSDGVIGQGEIHRVSFGITLLKILALGFHKIKEFDFFDAPCEANVFYAIKSLIQLGAIVLEKGAHKLTKFGWKLLKIGINPERGNMILKCFEKRLGREGLVLAVVMENSINNFFRDDGEENQEWDRLKVQFCHPGGDLFTLLSVYRKWDCTPRDKRNQWCLENRINARSMRRFQEAVQELEDCLHRELNIVIPVNWCWNPVVNMQHDQILRDVILSVLAFNIAKYSGRDGLGYELASTGAHFELHPSCSLLMFRERPSWVVFMGLLGRMDPYLVCVTSVDFKSLHTLSPPQIDSRILQLKVLTGFGTTLLKRFCGKSGSSLKHLVSQIRDAINDYRIQLEVSVDHNKVNLFASSEHMRQVSEIVNSALEREGKWIENECLKKCLFPGRHELPPMALLGSGAEIKHLELENRCLTVDVFVHGPCGVDEKELLSFLEMHASGNICAVHKLGQKNEKWGEVTFLTPEAAEKATKLTTAEFKGCKLKIAPSRSIVGGDKSFPAVKAKVMWPRTRTRGRGVAFVENPSLTVLQEALLREVRSLMPAAGNECVRVRIFPCEPMDYFMKAEISFDGSLHLEAAKALEQIDGKALPGCQAWQWIKVEQQFTSSVSCPASAYMVIKDQLHSLLKTLQLRKGVKFLFDRNENGTYRVKIFAKATKIMAESRRPLELLMNGRTIIDDRLTPPVIQLIFSREGLSLQKSIQGETNTYFLFDRRSLSFRVFGPLNKLDLAQHRLVQALVVLHSHRRLDVHLRGPTFPPYSMKKMVENFGKVQPRPRTSCSICLCDVEDGYRLEKCNHEFCRSCLVEQCESAIKNPGNRFPIRCASEGCGALFLAVDLKSLLLNNKLDEILHASLRAFVASSNGKYRFCPSPDCPSVYQVGKDRIERPFACGVCSVETCTQCHLEYHPFLSCETYRESKRDLDLSFK